MWNVKLFNIIQLWNQKVVKILHQSYARSTVKIKNCVAKDLTIWTLMRLILKYLKVTQYFRSFKYTILNCNCMSDYFRLVEQLAWLFWRVIVFILFFKRDDRNIKILIQTSLIEWLFQIYVPICTVGCALVKWNGFKSWHFHLWNPTQASGNN